MTVLVACEFSGIVRDAFIAKGHNAYSCDLLPSERPGPHIQDDVLKHLNDGWDMMIAFPPCTRLCVSGARWFKDYQPEQAEALHFVQALMAAPIGKIALENPVGVISTKIRKPDQIVQPWMFGHPETKKTCLWLKNLPPLMPTDLRFGREQRIHKMPPSPDRGKERSRTYQGIAQAMARQWGAKMTTTVGCIEGDKEPKTLSCEGNSTQDNTQWSGEPQTAKRLGGPDSVEALKPGHDRAVHTFIDVREDLYLLNGEVGDE